MRLIGYLLVSYVASYVAHVPVHGSFRNAFIPAAVPWAIAAIVAIWCTVTGRTLRIAWMTLAAACAFFLLGHIIPHADRKPATGSAAMAPG